MSIICVYINNKEYKLEDASTVSDAINSVAELPKRGIAIALNNEVVPSAQWGTKILSDGDRLTIIKAFYGG